MENQLITGYDGSGFLTAPVWPGNPFTPARVTFGTWAELGKAVHVNFYTIEKVEPADPQAAILASLEYAVDLWRNPEQHGSTAYDVGPKAYDYWIAAVPTAGSGHGNWWNATVWSECRRMAAAYCAAIGKANEPVADLCAQLNAQYLKIAENLGRISDKAMAPDVKIQLLKETKVLEAGAIEQLQELAAALRQRSPGRK